MRDFEAMKRQRSRNRGGNGKPQANANKSFDSTGPEGTKVRGSAQHIYDRYCQLARDAASSGDRVLAENYLQYAEHYFRLLRIFQPQRSETDSTGKDPHVSGFAIDAHTEEGDEDFLDHASESERSKDGNRQYRDRGDARASNASETVTNGYGEDNSEARFRDRSSSSSRNRNDPRDRSRDDRDRYRDDTRTSDRRDNGRSRDNHSDANKVGADRTPQDSRSRRGNNNHGRFRDRSDSRESRIGEGGTPHNQDGYHNVRAPREQDPLGIVTPQNFSDQAEKKHSNGIQGGVENRSRQRLIRL